MTVRIEMLPAAHGDCLWVEWTHERSTHRMLIDGGPAFTYPRLLERISQLPREHRVFELLVITHIDADHIDGIVRLLLDADALGVRFERIWFNSRRQLDRLPDRVGDGLGVVAGEYVQLLLDELEARHAVPIWNVGFENGVIHCEPSDGSLPSFDLPGGLTLTVLSPDLERLHDLDVHWEAELARLGVDVGRLDELRTRLDGDARLRPLADELGGPAEDIANTDVDDDRMPFEELPSSVEIPLPDELGGGAPGEDLEFGADPSQANGSSIALVAEWEDGPAALLAGDAFAGVLEVSVRRLLAERRSSRLDLDVFKVPHHGSVSNLTEELLDLLRCATYMISTSGAQFGHPHQRAIELLVEHHHHRARPRLIFNYHSETTSSYATELVAGRRCKVHYPQGSTGTF